jgi:hypothetical protein
MLIVVVHDQERDVELAAPGACRRSAVGYSL